MDAEWNLKQPGENCHSPFRWMAQSEHEEETKHLTSGRKMAKEKA